MLIILNLSSRSMDEKSISKLNEQYNSTSRQDLMKINYSGKREQSLLRKKLYHLYLC